MAADRASFSFRRIDGRDEWRDDSGRYVMEKATTEGPRGGSRVTWNLYEIGDRMRLIASERRRRDLWKEMS